MRLDGSSNIGIVGNNITANDWNGISIYGSSNISIVGNNIAANTREGIYMLSSSNISIIGNNITAHLYAAEGGIYLRASSKNRIVGNNITNNHYGIYFYESSDNIIYHNNFIGNQPMQVYNYHYGVSPSINVWDDGYPSGGNYWSDYTEKYPNASEIDDSDIWDTPYVIDEDNQDNYPIIPEFSSVIILPLFMILTMLAIIFAKKKTAKKLKA
jgi:parallel beta-helix repeat protein